MMSHTANMHCVNPGMFKLWQRSSPVRMCELTQYQKSIVALFCCYFSKVAPF